MGSKSMEGAVGGVLELQRSPVCLLTPASRPSPALRSKSTPTKSDPEPHTKWYWRAGGRAQVLPEEASEGAGLPRDAGAALPQGRRAPQHQRADPRAELACPAAGQHAGAPAERVGAARGCEDSEVRAEDSGAQGVDAPGRAALSDEAALRAAGGHEAEVVHGAGAQELQALDLAALPGDAGVALAPGRGPEHGEAAEVDGEGRGLDAAAGETAPAEPVLA